MVRMVDLMQQRLKEAEGLKKKNVKIPRTCQFGKTKLVIKEKDDPTAYRPLENLPVDPQ